MHNLQVPNYKLQTAVLAVRLALRDGTETITLKSMGPGSRFQHNKD